MICKIGLGGGCHWCTEAVFASLTGVVQVDQGWIASVSPQDAFSEAVVVTYDPAIISLKDLAEIHLHTHASTADHSMRHKYRSAIYWFDAADQATLKTALSILQSDFAQPLVTRLLPFASFKLSVPEQLNYYYADPERPFCKRYIHPKLEMLRKRFTGLASF